MKSEFWKTALSAFITFIILLLIVVGILFSIVPQLVESISEFINNIRQYVIDTVALINRGIDKINDMMNATGENQISHINAEDILNSDTKNSLFATVFEQIYIFLTSNLTNISSWLTKFIVSFYDVIIGLIFSFSYLIFKKQIFALFKKIGYAILPEKTYKNTVYFFKVANNSFGGFIKGKIIDSVIIGVLAYVTFVIFDIPYPLLLSTFVGITNIIPFIGPIIGAIPTAIIVLLTDPIKTIPFLLMVLVIQQLDGNVIGPAILGPNTGISALCVMIAITTVGEIWGLLGMLLGVPIYATILYIVDELTVKKLKEKQLSTCIVDYYEQNGPVDAFRDARHKKRNLIKAWFRRVYHIRAHMGEEDFKTTFGDRFLLSLYLFFVKLHWIKEPKPKVMDNPSINHETIVISSAEQTVGGENA